MSTGSSSTQTGAPIRVGVVGCGRAALDLHLPTLAAVDGAEAVAISDPDPAALERAGQGFGIERRASDHRELLDDPSIEAVCVAAPSHLHREIGVEALEAGKHLMVEKPLALTLGDCDELVERAAASDLRATVGFNLRLHPLVVRARELVRGGELGRISLLRSTFASPSLQREVPQWRADPALGGGLLALQAVHHMDLWRHLLGEPLADVRSAEGAPAPGGGPGAVSVSATSESGVAISGSFSAVTGQENDFGVFGTEAWVGASLYRFDSLDLVRRDETTGDIGRRLRRSGRYPREVLDALPRLRRGGDFQASYLAEWSAFAAAIRGGGPVPCTFDEAREVTRILLAVLEAGRSGGAVALADAPRTPPG